MTRCYHGSIFLIEVPTPEGYGYVRYRITHLGYARLEERSFWGRGIKKPKEE